MHALKTKVYIVQEELSFVSEMLLALSRYEIIKKNERDARVNKFASIPL